jgi:hypothetical protein
MHYLGGTKMTTLSFSEAEKSTASMSLQPDNTLTRS